MYDKGKILAGLAVFLAMITLPFWYSAARGKAAAKADPVLPKTEKKCVEPRQYMRESHMELLNRWRDAVVREGRRIYIAQDGTRYEMSLHNTCMKCHAERAEFCDKCHTYVGESPYCWDCHLDRKGIKGVI